MSIGGDPLAAQKKSRLRMAISTATNAGGAPAQAMCSAVPAEHACEQDKNHHQKEALHKQRLFLITKFKAWDGAG
jgi:hypothetical protein